MGPQQPDEFILRPFAEAVCRLRPTADAAGQRTGRERVSMSWSLWSSRGLPESSVGTGASGGQRRLCGPRAAWPALSLPASSR